MAQKAQQYLELLKDNEIIPENEMRALCEDLKEIFLQEPNVAQIAPPVTVCGDIHG